MVACTRSDQYDFSLCSTEATSLKNWLLTHRCDKTAKSLEDCDTFLTSSYSICFTPSGVGPSIVIECNCGECVNITHWEHA